MKDTNPTSVKGPWNLWLLLVLILSAILIFIDVTGIY